MSSGFDGHKTPETTNWEEHGASGDISTGRRLKYVQLAPLAYKFASNASLTYHGLAAPGITAGASLWRIMREDRLSGGDIEFADGNDLFDNQWSTRETYVYY